MSCVYLLQGKAFHFYVQRKLNQNDSIDAWFND